MKHEFVAASREEWRSWLMQNRSTVEEVWLVYYKKHTGKPSISYIDSLEEALCFGWIDGIKRRIDEEKYAHRFTPRKLNSKWSERNVRLAKKMIEECKMTPSGLSSFKQRVSYGDKVFRAKSAKEIPIPAEIEDALKGNEKVWNNFINLAPGYKKQYALWLTTAKKIETREKRLKEAIKLLAKNKKLGMK
jgi:uncharacterized protein YdeI (YjbR/CyaY-like superfamily)